MRVLARGLAASFLLALVLPGTALAEAKSLHWAELAVHARLDAGGVLHVEERHVMVFTGDWNGGERRFNLRLGQRLTLQQLRRIDPATGSARPLVEGDLGQVDHYAWADHDTLRWRSRRPADPPFQETAIPYVLDYTLSGVLEKSGGLYHLWHDFAFPERSGEIVKFSLDLALDPAWRPVAEVPGHLERRDLPPGESVLVKADLAYQGAAEDRLAGIRAATPTPLRAVFFAAALLAMILLFHQFQRGEAALGRFTPPAVPPAWDDAWLRDNVFLYRPEEVGALWDRKVGAPEVAAVLARLVGEGKLASEVRSRRGLLGKDVLHLTLKRDRGVFEGYERQLIDKLFFDGRTETDTDIVRKHYEQRGFDPASTIRGDLEKRLRTHAELKGANRPGGGRRTLGLFLATFALFGLDCLHGWEQSLILALIVIFGVAWLYGAGMFAAFAWRSRTERLDTAALGFVFPELGILALCLLATFFDDWFPARFLARPGLFGDLALALLPVATWSSLLNNARSRETGPALHRRQLLAAARRMFQRELEQRQPRLHDEWLPYLLAFGLHHDVDRWFRAFGGARASGGGIAAATSSSSFGAAGTAGGDGWTGGGGSFGGAGASASWAAAATGLAAGVSAPSSSGGGGGGGGGSSGGGGGGGW
jgi:uncharacterized membrane protein YgcG